MRKLLWCSIRASYSIAGMGAVTDADRSRRVAELTTEISAVARELAEVGLAADLAVARDDWDVIYSSSERMLDLHHRWAALYRRLLVVRTDSSRVSERTSC
jgi:hypothetical protein